MSPDIDQQRREAHDFLDRLPPAQVPAVRGLLEAMLEPSGASFDDEPVTEWDRHRIREGQAWFAERVCKGVPMEDVLADFGLRQEGFPLSKRCRLAASSGLGMAASMTRMLVAKHQNRAA